MQTDFEKLFYEAEDHYLTPSEMANFKNQVNVLRERLETYKLLRDREIAIFQPIADNLVETFSEKNPQLLERAIKHWLCVMRYGAMAMLLNNPDYFQHRLLEWLTNVIQAHEMVDIEKHLYELLENSLQKMLDKNKFKLLKPFLTQAYEALLDQPINKQLVIVGEDA